MGMNPQQQRAHGQAVGRAHRRIDTLAECVDLEIAEKMVEIRELVTKMISEERTHRLRMEQEQRCYIDLMDHDVSVQAERLVEALAKRVAVFENLTFRKHLRWMFTGVPPK